MGCGIIISAYTTVCRILATQATIKQTLAAAGDGSVNTNNNATVMYGKMFSISLRWAL